MHDYLTMRPDETSDDLFLGQPPEERRCFGKVAAAEKSAVGGKRRRVRSFQYRMAVCIDPFGLALGIAIP